MTIPRTLGVVGILAASWFVSAFSWAVFGHRTYNRWKVHATAAAVGAAGVALFLFT